MSGHPTILELELARTGDTGGEIDDHVAACAACRVELDFLERLARDQGAADVAFEAPAPFEDEMTSLALGHAARARRELAARDRSGRRRFVRMAPWAAAAAGIAIVATAGILWRGAPGSPGPAERATAAVARADDVNRDGRVDVLDAFALARAVEAGNERREWDVNRDGAVDAVDVDAVALAAVALGGGDAR